MTRWWLLLVTVSLAACARDVAQGAVQPDAGARAAGAARAVRPVWPADLMSEVVALRVQRGEAVSSLRFDDAAGWQMDVPFRGEADPDAVDRLRFVLHEPLFVEGTPLTAGPPDFQFELKKRSGQTVRLLTWPAALGAPIAVRVEGIGDFVVSPVEFGPKLPEPERFVPPALWVAARQGACRMTVRPGPGARGSAYELAGSGEDWHVVRGNKGSKRELDDLVGVIIGRQIIGHSKRPPEELGLARPTAVATLCLTDGGCREFRFGSAKDGATVRYYAQGPDSDPAELRDNDWKLLVSGP